MNKQFASDDDFREEMSRIRNKQFADDAFQEAIDASVLSEDEQATNFAGNYMYMGYFNGKGQFKNINTRAYIA